MTISPDALREEQALDWARRIADPDFSDWTAHIEWLEQDSGNAALFDRVCLDLETACEGLEAPEHAEAARFTANDNQAELPPARRRWRWPAGLATVAAAGGALFIGLHQPAPGVRIIETPGGATRSVALADGTQIAMNGGTRLRMIGDRVVALDAGEAFFTVVHDAQRPFALRIGETEVRDIGTAFDVSRRADATQIAVREGMVSIAPQSADVRLAAGEQARIGRDGTIIRQPVSQPDAIGGWRTGRLIYQGAPWTDVVTDLSRSLGVAVSIDPQMAARPFTGVIAIDKNPATTIGRLAKATGLSAVRDAAGWRLARP
jgi:transmembrane sensor